MKLAQHQNPPFAEVMAASGAELQPGLRSELSWLLCPAPKEFG